MNATEWSALWGLMNERFPNGGQPRSPELAGFYLTELSLQMTDVQIKQGVRKVLVSARFFPSPDEIMAAAGLSGEDAALAEWDACQALMEGRPGAFDRLSDTGKRMVRLLGGEYALRNTPLDSVPFVRKEWLKLYASAQAIEIQERREALPPMTSEGRRLLKAAMDNEPMPDLERTA
jgi:hypothetical protein